MTSAIDNADANVYTDSMKQTFGSDIQKMTQTFGSYLVYALSKFRLHTHSISCN